MKLIFAISFLLLSQGAMAQDQIKEAVPDKVEMSEKKELGWKPALSLGANISFGKSSNVVGQPDGDTTTIGGNLKGAYNYTGEKDEWRNSLQYSGATSETPTIPKFVKTVDDLKLESLYLYSLEKYSWLGPYARVSMQTSIFKGEDVQASGVTYEITRQSGAVETVNAGNLTLTDGFKPMTLKESVGFFAKILDKKTKKSEARLGLGAVQVIADGQLALADDAATAEIEVTELKSYEQVGLEAAISFEHQLDEKTKYTLGVEALIPFVNDLDDTDDRKALELTNWDAFFNVTSKVYEWVSLSYEFKLKRQPQLVDETQTQHLALINFNYTIF